MLGVLIGSCQNDMLQFQVCIRITQVIANEIHRRNWFVIISGWMNVIVLHRSTDSVFWCQSSADNALQVLKMRAWEGGDPLTVMLITVLRSKNRQWERKLDENKKQRDGFKGDSKRGDDIKWDFTKVEGCQNQNRVLTSMFKRILTSFDPQNRCSVLCCVFSQTQIWQNNGGGSVSCSRTEDWPKLVGCVSSLKKSCWGSGVLKHCCHCFALVGCVVRISQGPAHASVVLQILKLHSKSIFTSRLCKRPFQTSLLWEQAEMQNKWQVWRRNTHLVTKSDFGRFSVCVVVVRHGALGVFA